MPYLTDDEYRAAQARDEKLEAALREALSVIKSTPQLWAMTGNQDWYNRAADFEKRAKEILGDE